jgi:hypothetical protein
MLEDINCLIKRKSLKVISISLLSGLLITFLTIPLNSQEVTDTTTVAETAVAAAADVHSERSQQGPTQAQLLSRTHLVRPDRLW